MNQIRKRLTYANVMSSIAVFLVLGGAAYAAGQLPKNSVGTTQLKSNAVNSSKVKNGSLLSADFKAGQIPAGPRGATGPQGPQGVPGSDAFGELVYKEGAGVAVANNEQVGVRVDCDAGYHVIGGGILSLAAAPGEDVNSSFPSKRGSFEAGNEGWAGFVDNTTGSAQAAQAFAVCAKAGKVTGP